MLVIDCKTILKRIHMWASAVVEMGGEMGFVERWWMRFCGGDTYIIPCIICGVAAELYGRTPVERSISIA